MNLNIVKTKFVRRLKTGESTLCYSERLGWHRDRIWYGPVRTWVGTLYRTKHSRHKTTLERAARYYAITQEELLILALTYGK